MSRPPNDGKAWTDADDRFLSKAWANEYMSIQDIADYMGRTYDAIKCRAWAMVFGDKPPYVPPWDPWRSLHERLTWLYGDASRRMAENANDLEKWERLGNAPDASGGL